ncbi:MAG: DNA-binding response regulator [Planctomycetota bacterium]|nr:MAG: DNA-binding response regulator [Planctomycetota bacterium]
MQSGTVHDKERRLVLVVEDDAALRTGLCEVLGEEGYQVLSARDGRTGLELALERDPDVVILDIMLPRMSGIEVCRRLHEERIRGAILLLTAKATDRDRVSGLRAGADDYLTKPFHLEELLLRVRALMRRTPAADDAPRRYAFAGIELDFEKFEARRHGEPLRLTPREFKIMRLFCESPGRVVSRNELLDKVWGYDAFPTTRTVDNHIVKLRKAIEPDPANPRHIVSVRGVGYKFVPEPEAAPGTENDPL